MARVLIVIAISLFFAFKRQSGRFILLLFSGQKVSIFQLLLNRAAASNFFCREPVGLRWLTVTYFSRLIFLVSSEIANFIRLNCGELN